MATKGRVEYHFVVFGGVSLLVKFELGTGEERANAVGQVIAECDGINLELAPYLARTHILACDYSNDRQNFPSPIYGILCDGRTFEFFMFDGGTSPVFTAIWAASPSQISTLQQMMTALTVYDLSARFYSTFFFSLIGPEFAHIWKALSVIVSKQIALDRVRQVGERRRILQLWPYRMQRMLPLWQALSTLRLMERRTMLLTACSKGLQFGGLISDHRIY
jgi:hypothetical protein